MRRKLFEEILERRYETLQKTCNEEIQKLNINDSLSDKMKNYISLLREKKMLETNIAEYTAKNDSHSQDFIKKCLMDGLLY
jgi:ribonuclease HII